MPKLCPECGEPVVSHPCFCALARAAAGAQVTSGRVEGGTEKSKKSLEDELKNREAANERTKKAIRELLGRKLDLMTTGVGWAKTYHALVFRPYEPRAIVKKGRQLEIVGEPDADVGETKAEIAGTPNRRTSPGEIAAVVLVVIVLAAFALPIAAMALLLVSPLIALVLAAAAVVLALIYVGMAYKYIIWFATNAARSWDEKAALAVEAQKLDGEIEVLRRQHEDELARIGVIKERLREMSVASKAKQTARTDAASAVVGTGLLPGFEEMAEPLPVEETSPERPGGIRHQHGPQNRSKTPRRRSTIMNDLPRKTNVRCKQCGRDCPAIEREFAILYECGRCGRNVNLTEGWERDNKVHDGYLYGLFQGYASPDDWNSEQWKNGKSMAAADLKSLKETSPASPFSAFRPREKPVTSAPSNGSGETKPSGRKSEWEGALESKDRAALMKLLGKKRSEPRKWGRRDVQPSRFDSRPDDVSPPVVHRRSPPPPPQAGLFDRFLLGMSMLMNHPCPHCRSQMNPGAYVCHRCGRERL